VTAQPGYQPYVAHPPYGFPPPQQPRNGLGLAALIIGLVGCLFGLVPLTGFIGVVCALVALPLGFVGLARVRRHVATNRKTTWFGLATGTLALVLGIWGIVIVFQAADRLVDDLNAAVSAPGVVTEGPAAPAAPSMPTGSLPPVDAAATGVATFGERFTFSSGLAIEVAQPQAYRPASSAAGHDRDRAVIIETTVINGNDEPYEFNDFIMGPTATHDSRPASAIFDSANDIGMTPMTTILPGKSFTFRKAVSIGESSAELQLEYRADMLGETAIFTGQV
jgi:hypothetical protein